MLAGASLTAVMAQTHVEGEEYYKADKYTDAKDLLLRSLKNAATDKAVSDYYLGMISLEDENKAEAAKYFNQGLQQNPNYPYNYVGQGLLQLMSGDLKSAETSFKEAEKLTKKDAKLEVAIARAYDFVDPVKYEKQISKSMEKARKYNMSEPDIYVFEGDIAKRNRDSGQAGAMYEMAVNNDKNATYAYVKYANLFQMVNQQYGIDMLKQLLKVNPNSALGQRQLADTYYNQKEFLKAAEEYGKYVQNPSHFKRDEARYIYLLYYAGDNQKGYDYATKVLKEDPQNFTAQQYQYWHAREIPALSQKTVELADALRAAAAANPKSNKLTEYTYGLLVDTYKKAKQSDKVASTLTEGMKAYPNNTDFYKELGLLLIDKEDYTGAADAYAKYVENGNPKFNDLKQCGLIQYYAARTNMDKKDVADKYLKAATATAEKIKGIYPDHYWAYKLLGDIAVVNGNKDAAKSYYQQAIPLLEKSENASYYASDLDEMKKFIAK